MSRKSTKIVNPVSERMVKPIKAIEANMPQRFIQMQYDRGGKGLPALIIGFPGG